MKTDVIVLIVNIGGTLGTLPELITDVELHPLVSVNESTGAADDTKRGCPLPLNFMSAGEGVKRA